jgi:hypothetical protein
MPCVAVWRSSTAIAKATLNVFLRLPANPRMPEHRHASAERMVLVAAELNRAL